MIIQGRATLSGASNVLTLSKRQITQLVTNKKYAAVVNNWAMSIFYALSRKPDQPRESLMHSTGLNYYRLQTGWRRLKEIAPALGVSAGYLRKKNNAGIHNVYQLTPNVSDSVEIVINRLNDAATRLANIDTGMLDGMERRGYIKSQKRAHAISLVKAARQYASHF